MKTTDLKLGDVVMSIHDGEIFVVVDVVALIKGLSTADCPRGVTKMIMIRSMADDASLVVRGGSLRLIHRTQND